MSFNITECPMTSKKFCGYMLFPSPRAVTAIFGTGPSELGILSTFWGKLGKIHLL